MAVKFSSPWKNHSLRPSKTMIPIKFYRNTKNNSFLFCNYKIKLYLCSGIERPLLSIRASSPLWEELAIGRRQERVENSEARLTREKKANGQKPTPSTVILNSFQDLTASHRSSFSADRCWNKFSMTIQGAKSQSKTKHSQTKTATPPAKLSPHRGGDVRTDRGGLLQLWKTKKPGN